MKIKSILGASILLFCSAFMFSAPVVAATYQFDFGGFYCWGDDPCSESPNSSILHGNLTGYFVGTDANHDLAIDGSELTDFGAAYVYESGQTPDVFTLASLDTFAYCPPSAFAPCWDEVQDRFSDPGPPILSLLKMLHPISALLIDYSFEETNLSGRCFGVGTDCGGFYYLDTYGIVDVNELSAVPVPAAVWLFGTALIGLVGFTKRRKAA